MEATFFMSRRLTPQGVELRTDRCKAFCEYPDIVAEALEQDVSMAPGLGKTLAKFSAALSQTLAKFSAALSQTFADFGAELSETLTNFGAALSQTLAEFGAQRHLQRVDPLAKPADCLRRFDVHRA